MRGRPPTPLGTPAPGLGGVSGARNMTAHLGPGAGIRLQPCNRGEATDGLRDYGLTRADLRVTGKTRAGLRVYGLTRAGLRAYGLT